MPRRPRRFTLPSSAIPPPLSRRRARRSGRGRDAAAYRDHVGRSALDRLRERRRRIGLCLCWYAPDSCRVSMGRERTPVAIWPIDLARFPQRVCRDNLAQPSQRWSPRIPGFQIDGRLSQGRLKIRAVARCRLVAIAARGARRASGTAGPTGKCLRGRGVERGDGQRAGSVGVVGTQSPV